MPKLNHWVSLFESQSKTMSANLLLSGSLMLKMKPASRCFSILTHTANHSNSNLTRSSHSHYSKLHSNPNHLSSNPITGAFFYGQYQYQQKSALSVKKKDKDDHVKEIRSPSKIEEVPSSSWIDVYLPEQVRPYAKLGRLDKPIGSWLFAWPCLWSIALAASPGTLPDFKMLTLLGWGTTVVRGAACTINDILDRDIDAQVERTKSRPIASGVLTPSQGYWFLGLQSLVVLGFLLQLNSYGRILGASYLLLFFTYPFMKRITYWAQGYLGLAMSWSCLMGYAAVTGHLDPSVILPLYVSGVSWTIVYDTIYAHQDKEDDKKVGAKSTALLFGDSTKEWLTGFASVCIGTLALSGFNADLGWPFYAFLAASAGHLGWQIWTIDLSSPKDCSNKFVSNKWFGAVVFSGILLGRLC